MTLVPATTPNGRNQAPHASAVRPPALLFAINTLFTERYELAFCVLYKLNTSSRYSPTSPLGDRGLILGQYISDLWCTSSHWDRIFPKYFGFFLSVSFRQCSILVSLLILFLSEGQAGEVWEPLFYLYIGNT